MSGRDRSRFAAMLILVAAPVGFVGGYYGVSPEQLSWTNRLIVHLAALLVTYPFFYLWLHFRPRFGLALVFFFLGISSRFLVLLLPAAAYWMTGNRTYSLMMILYLISIGSFLFFEVVSVGAIRNLAPKREQDWK